MEAVADRVEMQKNIGDQSNEWNSGWDAALATVANSLEHGGQVGMVFDQMYTSNAGLHIGGDDNWRGSKTEKWWR